MHKIAEAECPLRHVELPPKRRIWRRVLQLGFWFFLAKGLLWLAVPLAAWLGFSSWGG